MLQRLTLYREDIYLPFIHEMLGIHNIPKRKAVWKYPRSFFHFFSLLPSFLSSFFFSCFFLRTFSSTITLSGLSQAKSPSPRLWILLVTYKLISNSWLPYITYTRLLNYNPFLLILTFENLFFSTNLNFDILISW